MTDQKQTQSEIVHVAVSELASRLCDQGIPADVICAVMSGFAIGHAINIVAPEEVAAVLRQMAEQADAMAMPTAGSA